MKKVVRIVWIGALSGLAFLAACCSSKGLTRAEKKQLKRDRDSIQQVLDMHWMVTPENNPVARAEFEMESNRLQYQIDSINYRLGKNVDMDESKQRLEQSKQAVEMNKDRGVLQQRIEELRMALQRREGACVYGSPEVIQEYGKKTQEMRDELKALEDQLEGMDKK